MADFDKLSDTKGIIINFIEERVRELFYEGGTEYDFSPGFKQLYYSSR